MRKTTIRHIVHAILDLLPLFVIPIFAIYARNENAEFGYEVTINESYWENKLLYESDTEEGIETSLHLNTMYHAQKLAFSNFQGSIDNYFILNIYQCEEVDYTSVSLDETYFNEYNSNNENYMQIYYDGTTYISLPNNDSYLSYEIDILSIDNCDFVITDGLIDFVYFLDDLHVALQPSSFEVYEHIYHENEPITYNDTDIGSQMIYTLYNTVDKYFNMNNVFNMNQVYQWFEINIFGGTAPLAIYIVWNIVLYEFVMDLLMLLYALFMFFIDMCKKLMEKPLTSIK